MRVGFLLGSKIVTWQHKKIEFAYIPAWSGGLDTCSTNCSTRDYLKRWFSGSHSLNFRVLPCKNNFWCKRFENLFVAHNSKKTFIGVILQIRLRTWKTGDEAYGRTKVKQPCVYFTWSSKLKPETYHKLPNKVLLLVSILPLSFPSYITPSVSYCAFQLFSSNPGTAVPGPIGTYKAMVPLDIGLSTVEVSRALQGLAVLPLNPPYLSFSCSLSQSLILSLFWSLSPSIHLLHPCMRFRPHCVLALKTS